MLKLTKKADYGLIAVKHLAELGPNGSCSAKDIADAYRIPAEALERVFERFYRADPSRANRADGAGLGLSLVKWAVDQHHGSVQVNSTPGRGTTFVVKIPLQS